MHQVVFVVFPGFELLDMAGPVSVFNGANRAVVQAQETPFYDIALVSSTGGKIISSSGVAVDTLPLDRYCASDDDVGTLLIVGAESAALRTAMSDPLLGNFIPRIVENAQRFGSVCSGGIILAQSGLLDGCHVATHWDSYVPFQKHFPNVTVDHEALYIEQDRLWTSAGVTTGIDMALAMVGRDVGASVAADVARRLVLYARRPGYQSQFSPILSAQNKGENPFCELIEWIQSNLGATLDVPTLAARVSLTERSFHRKFTHTIGSTPARFVEKLRLDTARLLLSRGLSLKETASQVGLFPTSRFTRLFEQHFGLSPRTFREMHRLEE